MGQGGFRLLFVVLVSVTALVVAAPAGAAPSCATRLLDDWRDGRIDSTYPVACYRQALADLPEDIRVYSSAQSDITRALQARVQAQAAKNKDTGHASSGVSPLVVVAITAAILVAAGSVAAALR